MFVVLEYVLIVEGAGAHVCGYRLTEVRFLGGLLEQIWMAWFVCRDTRNPRRFAVMVTALELLARRSH